MKNCPQCNSECSDDDKFCQKCGYSFYNENKTSTIEPDNKEVIDNEAYKSHYSDLFKKLIKFFMIFITIINGVLSIILFFVAAFFMLIIFPLTLVIGMFLFFTSIYLFLSLAWNIPFTVVINRKLNEDMKISMTLMVFILIFTGIIPGILLLIGDNTKRKNKI